MSVPPVEKLKHLWTDGHWEKRLAHVVETMRELSRQTDPQRMVEVYGARVRQLMPMTRFISLSRRDLPAPRYRVTRTSLWEDHINPWTQRDRLPEFSGGLLGGLIYGDEPVVLDDFTVAEDDPAREFLEGMRSLVAIPLYDRGVALNMIVNLHPEPAQYPKERLPEHVWTSNLFGRATHNLVLTDQVRQAYDAVDRELQAVADIQRSLLPTELPKIPTLELAVHYQTSKRAGGDYYDFFPLPDGRWGILIADVSGHGTPAAVLMAVTHSIAHTHNGPPAPPSRLMTFINDHLTARYTNGSGTFVTAFYGIYDPADRSLTYCCAGHCPPRVRRARDGGHGAGVEGVQDASSLPLGIEPGETYVDCTATFEPGDVVVFYTDGITEARSPAGDLFGIERLDRIVRRCTGRATDLVECTLAEVDRFSGGLTIADDRTLLAAMVH